MISGQTKTEAQYRAVKMDSSSSLKEFSTNRKKYHKKYILNEQVEDEDNEDNEEQRQSLPGLVEKQEQSLESYVNKVQTLKRTIIGEVIRQ
jgi:hypothetical protein